jgi:hypothetical protein
MQYRITKFDGTLSQTVTTEVALEELLHELTDDEFEVIEAIGWTELHGVGDEYHGEYFSIYIEDKCNY